MNYSAPASVRLSIVIVSYNGGALLERCLASLHQHPASVSHEIIVVDNGSTDDSCDALDRRWPAVVRLTTGANIGLARAFNMALSHCRGEYVLSLDSDTRVLSGSLDQLVLRLNEAPRVGIVSGWLLNPDSTPQKTARRAPAAWNAIFGRRSLLTRLFPTNAVSRRYLMDDMRTRRAPFEADWVSTAALLIRRRVIESVGPMDEGFFVYWVDADWCARVRRQGWSIEAVPAAPVFHDENLKSGRRMRRRTRMIIDFHRGAYRYYRKHHIKHAWSPVHAVALVGLGARAAALIACDYVITALNRVRAAAAPNPRLA